MSNDLGTWKTILGNSKPWEEVNVQEWKFKTKKYFSLDFAAPKNVSFTINQNLSLWRNKELTTPLFFVYSNTELIAHI